MRYFLPLLLLGSPVWAASAQISTDGVDCAQRVEALLPERPNTDVGTVRIHSFDTGVTWMEEGWMINGASRSVVRIPVPVHLVQIGARVVVIDSGYNAQMLDDPQAYVGRAFYQAALSLYPVPTGTGHWAAAGWMKALGFDPSAVDSLIITHPHFDHTGGIPDIGARQVLIGEGSREQYGRGHFGLSGVMEDPADRAVEIPLGLVGLVDAQTGGDVLGDGSIRIVSLPGHAKGSMGVWVQANEGPRILFVGDAIYGRPNLGNMLPGFEHLVEVADQPQIKMRRNDQDPKAAAETLLSLWCLDRWQDTHDEAILIVPAHDPRLFEDLLPRAPEVFEIGQEAQ